MMISRRFLFALPFVLGKPAFAAQPYSTQWIKGGFDGEAYEGGLRVVLAPGWKTYWRVPGAGGIPPDVGATGTNLKSFAVSLPVPKRIDGEDGEAIGYKDEVVFPFRAIAADLSKPLDLTLAAFLGVCETICIPVQAKGNLSFAPTSAPEPGQALIEAWKSKLPRPGIIATQAEVRQDGGKLLLVVALQAIPQEIFVEGDPLLVFLAPHIDAEKKVAVFEVHGAASSTALVGASLRLTAAMAEGNLEQTVTVS